jgi:hypothetical protein
MPARCSWLWPCLAAGLASRRRWPNECPRASGHGGRAYPLQPGAGTHHPRATADGGGGGGRAGCADGRLQVGSSAWKLSLEAQPGSSAGKKPGAARRCPRRAVPEAGGARGGRCPRQALPEAGAARGGRCPRRALPEAGAARGGRWLGWLQEGRCALALRSQPGRRVWQRARAATDC